MTTAKRLSNKDHLPFTNFTGIPGLCTHVSDQHVGCFLGLTDQRPLTLSCRVSHFDHFGDSVNVVSATMYGKLYLLWWLFTYKEQKRHRGKWWIENVVLTFPHGWTVPFWLIFLLSAGPDSGRWGHLQLQTVWQWKVFCTLSWSPQKQEFLENIQWLGHRKNRSWQNVRKGTQLPTSQCRPVDGFRNKGSVKWHHLKDRIGNAEEEERQDVELLLKDTEAETGEADCKWVVAPCQCRRSVPRLGVVS